MSLEHLVDHLIDMSAWGRLAAEAHEVDVAAFGGPRDLPRDRAALLADFDAEASAFRDRVGAMEAARPGDVWTARHGRTVLYAMPRGAVLRGLVLNHLIRHRGQLSVYLRLLDVPVPSIYGPSADEQ